MSEQNLGLKINILHHGFVMIADTEIREGFYVLRDPSIISLWGTDQGLGVLCKGGPTSRTQLDPFLEDVFVDATKGLVFQADVNEKKWEGKLDAYPKRPELRGLHPNGENQVVVLERGFIVVGQVYQDEERPDQYRIENGSILRDNGTERGLGQVCAEGPVQGKTILDPFYEPVWCNKEHSVVFRANINEANWAGHLIGY